MVDSQTREHTLECLPVPTFVLHTTVCRSNTSKRYYDEANEKYVCSPRVARTMGKGVLYIHLPISILSTRLNKFVCKKIEHR